MEINNKVTSTSHNDATSSGSNSSTISFGHQLKQARVSRGLSLQDVEKELHILPRHLEALENEDFEALPQVAFARGFVMNYACFLGLDKDHIVRSFNHAYPVTLKKQSAQDITSPLRPMGTVQRHGNGRRSLRINPLLILGIVGVIMLAVFLLRMVTNAQHETSAEENAAATEVLSDVDQTAGAAITINRVPANSVNNLNSAGSAIETNVVGSDVETDTNSVN